MIRLLPANHRVLALAMGTLLVPCATHAGTVVLQSSTGGTWTGTANTCTYASVATDAAGNITVACQGGTTGPTPPTVLNAPNQSLTQSQAMTPLNLSSYVQATDGDPITGYAYTGTLPPGLNFVSGTGTISGTPTTAGTWTINWTAADKDGTSTADAVQFTVASGATAGSCPATPTNYTVVDAYDTSGIQYDSSTYTLTTLIAAGHGLALPFTINKTAYPFGYKVTDGVGGSKSYTISKCPGATTGPIDGQNGLVSVNGDTRNDNCGVLNMYVRYKETAGASASYYANTGNLSWQTTCFLPTTTALGSATPATYYLNVYNTGTSTVSTQLKNLAQIN